MKQLTGNLISLAEDGHFDVIVHGCNCFHAMGGGIAAEISRRYPSAAQADRETDYGSRNKLGNFSYVSVQTEGKSPFIIVNGYTQHRWSGSKDVFEYQAFDTLLNRLTSFLFKLHNSEERTIRVGFPKIGCGLAGGDESRILPKIQEFAKNIHPWCSVTLVTLG